MRLFALVVFIAVLGRVGEMDYQDREKADEFAREWVAVTDELGHPILVPTKSVVRGVRKEKKHGGSAAVRNVP